jgi:hypothetical protein
VTAIGDATGTGRLEIAHQGNPRYLRDGSGLCHSDDEGLDVTGGDDGPVDRGESGAAEEEQLLAELRRLGRLLDPVPAEVILAAKGSLAWRRVDAELAPLSFDSSVDREPKPAGARGDDTVRFVSFDGPDLSVEVEIAALGGRHRLAGRLAPPQAATIELRTPVARADRDWSATEADGLGRFVLDRVAGGPASLRCRLASGRAVETGWLLI